MSVRSTTEADATRDAVAEAHHRIANSLSVISSLVHMHTRNLLARRSTLDVSEVRLLLEEIKGRIDTVGRLHRLLVDAGDGDAVEIADYLRDVAASIVSSLSSSEQVALRFDLDQSCSLPPERVLHLGLIVSELVTNSVKYAHPTGVSGTLDLRCRQAEKGAVIVEVSDDGVGLPEGFDATSGGNNGLNLVRSLADRLDAEVTVHSSEIGLRHVILVRSPTSGMAVTPPSAGPAMEGSHSATRPVRDKMPSRRP